MSVFRYLLLSSLCTSALGNIKETVFEPVEKNRCEIKLVADYAFFRLIGNGNYANCARYLVNMVERINDIFTAVDWGLNPQGKHFVNMGFMIKEMKILDKPNNTPDHYNSNISTHGNGLFSAIDVLKSFSAEEGTSSTCVTFLITGKNFNGPTLGMANIARSGTHGICAQKKVDGTYYNTGIITIKRQSELMITRVVDLVFAHELGHLWGAVHDDLSDPECRETESMNGRFIMHESSNTGYDKNNYKFSSCSIQSIHRILYDVAEICFVNEQTALCGNGILEPGEECDPGGQLALGHPNTEDLCCTADCRLRSTAKCSPRQSECCSEHCSYLSRATMCQAKNTDNCKRPSYCTGMSDKCPNPLPTVDDTLCADEGRCKKGSCVSFCKIISPSLLPCTCENVTESCFRCCRSTETGLCTPIKPHRYLPEGAICIQGQCRNKVCMKESTDAATHFWRIIKDIGIDSTYKYLADYIVFIVVFISLIIWCPCGLYIMYRDRKNRKLIDNASFASYQEDHDDENDRITLARRRLRRNATNTPRPLRQL